MKTSILGTGLSGLVGSRIVELLGSKYQFEDLSYDTGVDISNRDQVFAKVKKSQAEWILHLAAKTDVDSCEKEKELGKKSAAWKINVEGTRNIVEAAKAFDKRVIYVSTDFVFDGNKEFYTEDDKPKPINWYSVTKHEGEILTLSNNKNLVVRFAYPYRAKCPNKLDFVHAIFNKLSNGEKIEALTDHVFTPTFIDDIAFAIDILVDKKASGIYHVVGESFLTPFEAAQLVARVFSLRADLVNKTTIKEFYKNRAPRPFKLAMKNDRISKLGVRMRTFLDGLKEIKQQGVA